MKPKGTFEQQEAVLKAMLSTSTKETCPTERSVRLFVLRCVAQTTNPCRPESEDARRKSDP